MKIVFVYEGISSIGGGSQMAVLNWLKNLKKIGIKVKLLCNKPKKPIKNLSEKDLIINQSLDISFIYPNFSISFPFLSQKTILDIKRFNPDILHFHEPVVMSLAIHQLAKKLNIKTIGSYHTNFIKAKVNSFPLSLIFKKNGVFSNFLDKTQFYLLSKSDFITAPSSFYKKILSDKLKKKTFILPYPIPDYFFLKNNFIPKKINQLITISRLSGEKNVDFLIETMKYLKNHFYLTIVGDGVDRKFLENKVKKLNLEKFIKFAGWIDNKDLPKILKKHHLFISTSDYETFGITYIEALAAGLPLLVYDYSVSKEIIPSSTSIFVKEFNPKLWANTLINIQKNPLIYQKLKENIRKNYDKIYYFNEINSAKKLIKIYKEVLK